MNLLCATTTLLDAVKTHAPEDDRIIKAAIKRMEKRLGVLQLRAAQAKKRNRSNAFWDAMARFSGGVSKSDQAVIPCKGCGLHIDFADFCSMGEYDGRGRIKSLTCPACNLSMEANQ